MKKPPRTGHWSEGASDWFGGIIVTFVAIGFLAGAAIVGAIWAIIHYGI